MGYLRSSSLLKYFLDIFPYRFVIDVVLAQFEIVKLLSENYYSFLGRWCVRGSKKIYYLNIQQTSINNIIICQRSFHFVS